MAQPRFENLLQVIHEAVETYPHRELFGTKTDGRWQWVTYREFGQQVDKLRGALASLGVVKGDRVAIIANNRVEWAVAAYATYGLGAAFVPMYEAQPVKEWEFILRDCGAKVLFVPSSSILEKTRGLLNSLSGLEHIVALEGGTNGSGGPGITNYAALLESGKSAPETAPARNDIAGLIYTSGTTGNPKGVILSHFNIASNISSIHEVQDLAGSDRSLSFLPWAHSFGQTVELHGLISMGASIAIAESVDKILDNLAEVRPTVIFSVPRVFNKIYAAVQKQLASKPKPILMAVEMALKVAAKERNVATAKSRSEVKITLAEHAVFAMVDRVVFSKVRERFGGRLRFAVSGGAAISKDVAEFIDALGITVYEGYGLTETSPIATANWPGERRIGSVGRAIPGVRIAIDVEGGKSTGESEAKGRTSREEGEIVVYGPNVMQGYFNRPEENAAAFTKDGGFRTGDMGYLDGSGYLYITGRIKEQYKLENGKYVVPTPLEDHLKLSPFVLNAMVYGDNRPFNVALIVANVEATHEWGASQGVTTKDPEALLKDPKVRALFKGEIAKYAAQFKGFEGIRGFALIEQDFTPENGMLTPKMSLKRRRVLEVYGKLIDSLYTAEREPRAKDTTTAPS